MKAVDGAYPLFGQADARSRPARSPTRWRNATARSAPSPIRSLLARLGIKPGARLTVGNAQLRNPRRAQRASRTSSPAASASGRACWSARTRCAPPACCSPAAWCAGIYRLRLPANDAIRRRGQSGDRRRRARNCPKPAGTSAARSNASPQLERNVERFTQFLTIVGLTALAGRRRRRRQCGEKPSRPPARHHRHA